MQETLNQAVTVLSCESLTCSGVKTMPLPHCLTSPHQQHCHSMLGNTALWRHQGPGKGPCQSRHRLECPFLHGGASSAHCRVALMAVGVCLSNVNLTQIQHSKMSQNRRPNFTPLQPKIPWDASFGSPRWVAQHVCTHRAPHTHF